MPWPKLMKNWRKRDGFVFVSDLAIETEDSPKRAASLKIGVVTWPPNTSDCALFTALNLFNGLSLGNDMSFFLVGWYIDLAEL
jgi:hypothetical protein